MMKEQIRNRWVCASLGIMTALAASGPVRAEVPPGYEIIQITDDALRDGAPKINSCGVVVWYRQLDARRESAEIFTYDDATGLITRITDDDVRDIFPSINDEGTIAWARGEGRDGAAEIAMWRDGELTVLTNNSYNDNPPSINNLGHLAWGAEAGSGCSEDEIFFFNGETIERITRNDGLSDQGPEINDRDEIAWTGYDFCERPWVGHILMYTGGEIRRLNEGIGQDAGNAINNVPQVAWDTADHRIIIWEDGNRRELTDGRGPRLNDLGHVAFIRWDEQRETWDQWLWKSGIPYELTRESQWNHGGRINNSSELVWSAGIGSSAEVMLLRRIFADGDGDGNVSLLDFDGLVDCLSGPGTEYDHCRCRVFDVDRDRDVDLLDFAFFQRVFADVP